MVPGLASLSPFKLALMAYDMAPSFFEHFLCPDITCCCRLKLPIPIPYPPPSYFFKEAWFILVWNGT